MLRNKGQIWSEDACRHIAADLYLQAEKWEKRAQQIAHYRGNLKHIEDVAPAMKAARRVLAGVQNGLDAMQLCTQVCRQYYLNFDSVWLLYRHLLTKYEREERAKRNRAIKKQAAKYTVSQLAQRFNLSRGQISKIVNG